MDPIETAESRRPRLVVIGAGFGGLAVVRSLKKTQIDITVIDRTNHHLFQPLLYQVATAGLSPAEIAEPIRSILASQSNVQCYMSEVTGIDTFSQTVFSTTQSFGFDYLVIATGAKYNYFGHPQWAEFAPSLKTLHDATLLRQKILIAFEAAEIEIDPIKRQSLLTFVIVGAGPTGVEMAGSIAELANRALISEFRNINPKDATILLLDAGPRILAGFSEAISNKATEALSRIGVTVKVESVVKSVSADGVVVHDEFIPSNTIIWAAGVTGSTASKWLNAETDRSGRIIVNHDLTIPGHSDIFVIGDTASIIQDGTALPGVAQVAIQGGQYVGRIIRNRLHGNLASPPFRYFDKGNMATIGRRFAVAERGGIRIHGAIAWLAWALIHIWYLIGFRNRLIVMAQWIWSYMTFQRGARIIIDQPLPECITHTDFNPTEEPYISS